MGIGEAMRLLFGVGFAAILVAVVSASADDHGAQDAVRAATPAAPASQPPGRVGQVGLVSGKVGFRSPGDTVWSDAQINDPIASGASLRTDPQARAVMRFGPDTIALAEDSEISIANLNDRVAEIAVSRGRISLDIPQFGNGQSVQIDFPHGGVWPLQSGRYDINT